MTTPEDIRIAQIIMENPDVMEAIRGICREKKENRRMSRFEKECGLSDHYISLLANDDGRRSMTIYTADKLLNALGYTLRIVPIRRNR